MSIQHNISIAGTVTVGPKGQVVVPVEVREKMNIKPGDKLIAMYVNDYSAVSFVAESEVQGMINRMGHHLTKLKRSLEHTHVA